jgi:anthranilate synthase component 2
MQILMIDNYDSFTYNLVQYLGELGATVTTRRNDALGVEEAMALEPDAIVLSPGPCTPDEAGICVELLLAAAGRIPVLGVCLGHQCIGQAFGAHIVHAAQVMHGKTSMVEHDGEGVFKGLASPYRCTRYHSLVIERISMPDCLVETAWVSSSNAGLREIMGVRHRSLPIEGVQFHPESVLTEHGHALLENFLRSLPAGAETA